MHKCHRKNQTIQKLTQKSTTYQTAVANNSAVTRKSQNNWQGENSYCANITFETWTSNSETKAEFM